MWEEEKVAVAQLIRKGLQGIAVVTVLKNRTAMILRMRLGGLKIWGHSLQETFAYKQNVTKRTQLSWRSFTCTLLLNK